MRTCGINCTQMDDDDNDIDIDIDIDNANDSDTSDLHTYNMQLVHEDAR